MVPPPARSPFIVRREPGAEYEAPFVRSITIEGSIDGLLRPLSRLAGDDVLYTAVAPVTVGIVMINLMIRPIRTVD